MATKRPCDRCGSFLGDAEAADGLRLCLACLDNLCRCRQGSGAVSAAFAFAGAVAAAGLALVGTILARGDVSFDGLVSFVAGGAVVGLFAGMPIDVFLVRRRRARDGFDRFVWIAVLELRGPKPGSEPGWALLGDRCVLFASANGTRRRIATADVVRATTLARGDQVTFELSLDGAPARFLVVGPNAGLLGARLAAG